MPKHISSIKQVKKELNVSDLSNLSTEKTEQFVSLLPNMDKDVAVACISQFGNFVEFGKITITKFYDLCDSAMKSAYNKTLEADMKILDVLSRELDKPTLSDAAKDKIVKQIFDVRDHIREIDTKKVNFFKWIISFFAKAGIALLTIITGGIFLVVHLGKRDRL